MTLHEQYKERISNCKKERNCKDEYCTSCYADEYIKQSFLDSIDCMIAMFKKEITIWKKEKIQFSDEDPKVIMRVYETEISRLSEQRELIANEK